MSKLQPVRGTHDLLPEAARRFRHIITTGLALAQCYGYGEIATPVFEFSDVFHRTLGDTSDVVTKETYNFTDRGGESLTLRPEFTAGIARAFISGNLRDQLPLKFFYAGPTFRYERPQKGRQRQFHQIGAELLGVDAPMADVETIALAHQMLKSLGLSDIVTLEINTLGDAESRANYRDALVAYFTAHQDALSEDSRLRLTRNPLRILDSKEEGDRAVIAHAPRMEGAMTASATAYFADVKAGLESLAIPFKINERLVRGLDYYNHTVFEFTTDLLGAQGTVLAGGRYDGLIALMGGPDTPGIGWAAGIERLAELMETKGTAPFPSEPRPIALIPQGEAAERTALALAVRLRNEGVAIDLAYKGNFSNRMKKANRARAVAAIILGETELAAGTAALKNLDTGEQSMVPLDGLISALAPYRNSR